MKIYTKTALTTTLLLILLSGLIIACTPANDLTQTNQSGKVVLPNGQENKTDAGEDPNRFLITETRDLAMGTQVTQKVYGSKGDLATEEALNLIRQLEELLTFNEEKGDLFNLNQNAGKQGVELDPRTIEVLKKAKEISELSDGVFDVTIGPVVRAWGFSTDYRRVPSPEELQALLPLVNYRDLVIEGNTAYLKQPGQMVDLGGIAKGYAGDEVIKLYKQLGVESAVVNLGGNVVTLGGKPDGRPWIIGIADPRNEGIERRDIAAIMVKDKAVVTAGDGERYFVEDGKRYHHIIDPYTGYPAESDLMSVTLITDSSFLADALDTALYILGLEKGMELVKQYGGIEAIFVTKDKKIHITDGLKDNFTLLDDGTERGYQLVE